MKIVNKTPDSLTIEGIKKKYVLKKKVPYLFDFKNASKIFLNGHSINGNRQIHYIHNYPGKIYFYIPLFFLSHPEFEKYRNNVLDPFAGSGTILAETILNPIKHRKAIGIEINPVARLISKVKTTKLDLQRIDDYLDELRKLYLQYGKEKVSISNFKNIDFWFSESAISKLSRLKLAIVNSKIENNIKDFFWLCFSNIVRKVSKADPFVPPPVLLKPIKYGKGTKRYKLLKKLLEDNEKPNVWKLFESMAISIKPKLQSLNGVKASIVWDDASCIRKGKLLGKGLLSKTGSKKFDDNSVDLIITSPPYITAQKYLRTTKLEALWLGYAGEEILILEKKTVGTEHVSEKLITSKLCVKTIDILIKDIKEKSISRAVMVYAYFSKMLEVMTEMYRVLKPDSYAILIVGDNKVLKKKVGTHLLIRDIGVKVGFKEIAILKDKIKSRSMMTKRNNTGGLIKNEFVIILKKI